jgi:tight adherence protein B
MFAKRAAGVVSVLLVLFCSMAVPAMAQSQVASPPRGVVVALDVSGSMGDSGIAAARQAARAYLDVLPRDVEAGLLTFDSKPRLVVPPTTDHARLLAGLDGVRSGGNTALFDAVRSAVDAMTAAGLGPDSQRRLVLLSDGEDTASTSSLGAATNLLKTAKIPADVVAFRYGTADSSGLQALAGAAGGRLLTADNTAQLAVAFASLTPPPGTATGEHDGSPAISWSWLLVLVLVTTFAALLLATFLLVGGLKRDEDNKRLVDQIRRYGPQDDSSAEADEEGALANTAVAWTRRLLGGREQSVAQRLDRAGMKLGPAEWTLLRLCVCAGLAAALTMLTGNAVVGILTGVVAGWLGTLAYVSFRTGRRQAAFGEQLPDVLQLIAGSLKSGFSLAQAIDSVVREGSQPAAGELSRALAETRIGAELEDALDHVASRMDSRDLSWVVMAVRIQREIGGNLAGILLNTVETMRERAQSRRQVRALSAEGRLSAYILVALPILVGGWLLWSRGDYMRPLFTTAVGIVMLAGAVVMVVLGSLWMRKLVRVEV